VSRLLVLGPLALLAACTAAPPTPAPPPPVVALFTDFGLQDDAVGLMRGVILRLAPRAQLVDLCHQVPRFDVSEGARLLADAPGSYPADTVFCVVVDPGVGTARRAIVAKLPGGSYVVAPDNGVITDLVAAHGVEEVRAVEDPSYVLEALSATFHGRDVFAPVAGNLAGGRSFEGVGPVVTDWVRLERPQPQRGDDALTGQVTAIDEPFGNVWTNLPPAWLEDLGLVQGDRVQVSVGEVRLEVPYVATFGDVPDGQPLLYMNSRGKLALALNMADFARTHGVERGQPVRLARQ
jgi:S-adenosylmethionine hydrolase